MGCDSLRLRSAAYRSRGRAVDSVTSAPQSMRVICLFNPISGGGAADAISRRLEQALAAAGNRVERLATAREPARVWLDPVLAGADRLIVCGGDGTVRLAEESAARCDVPLYHAPAGTENLFARSFGMTADPEAVRRAVESGDVRRIDRGSVGGERFLIMASTGFDAAVVHDLAARRRGSISRGSYAGPILRQLRHWQPANISARVDGDEVFAGTGFVVVANLAAYARQLDPARLARADDGLLDLVAFPASGASGLLRWIAEIASGLHLHDRRLTYRVGQRIELEGDRPLPIQVDGDAAATPSSTSVRIEVDPASLPLCLPR